MIGVFDSGVGGLSVLSYFLKELPDYNYIYFGDNARAPYGSKSQEVIYNYTCEVLDFLFSKNCKLVILACNTASAQALRKIQQDYLPKKYLDKKVIGVVRPLVEAVAREEKIKKVGILGTKATINSHVYKTELEKLNPGLEIYEQSAPLLVPLIEEGWSRKKETKIILRKYLRSLKDKKIQSLILACTHYPFLFKEIQNIMGKRCQVYNPGEIIAQSLENYLARHKELNIEKQKKSSLEFYTTDDINKFKEIGEKFLDRKIDNIQKVVL